VRICIFESFSNLYRPYYETINWHNNVFSLYNALLTLNLECYLIGLYDYFFFNKVGTFESKINKILSYQLKSEFWYNKFIREILFLKGYHSLLRWVKKKNIEVIVLTYYFKHPIIINRLIETLKNFYKLKKKSKYGST